MGEIVVQEEQPGDAGAIRDVNREAFETDEEADLVDRLRKMCSERLSLVALVENVIVGHILFTPVDAQAGTQQVKGMGLAPMAVRPFRQRRGIGSALVRRGLEMVREAGYPFVIVLGHPNYYPRFGFEPASDYGLKCEFEGVPDEAFMIAVFDRVVVGTASGEVKYRPEFALAK